jgi:isoleucyl-tRNA synthetase
VSRVQRLRRDSGLEVSDRIRLVVGADGEAHDAVREFSDYISHETLATDLKLEAYGASTGVDIELEGSAVRIALEPAG